MGAGGVQLRSLQRQEVVANLGAWPQGSDTSCNKVGWVPETESMPGYFECVPSKKKVDHRPSVEK